MKLGIFSKAIFFGVVIPLTFFVAAEDFDKVEKIKRQSVPISIQECAKIFDAEIRDGVIHGATVIAGGLEGETLPGN